MQDSYERLRATQQGCRRVITTQASGGAKAEGRQMGRQLGKEANKTEASTATEAVSCNWVDCLLFKGSQRVPEGLSLLNPVCAAHSTAGRADLPAQEDV